MTVKRFVDAHSGAYGVLRALDREEKVINEVMREKVREALEDTRPGIPAGEVFARLERKHRERMKVADRDV